ncbi:lysophospholipase II [Acrasis kona]|uniref:Lysophospholipase II n=1 Tax=Acrasis kona TaxID=1008807 RepID=A0AAW2ZRM9_9EUKA
MWEQFHQHKWDEDEKWKLYFNNLTIPESASEFQRGAIVEKYKRKFFSQNIGPLPSFKSVYELVEIDAQSKHTATLIFLHGLGDSGEGWASAFVKLSKSMPYLKVILPSALKLPVTLNGGARMPAWYDLMGLSESSGEDSVGFQETVKQLKALIKNENEEFNIPVRGFSQGGSLSLYVGLTLEKQLAGVIGMSTFLLQKDQFIKEVQSTSANINTPVLICQGTADQVVRHAWGKATYDGIKKIIEHKNGKEADHITFREYSGLAHNANASEMQHVYQFIQERLNHIQ